MRGVVELIVGSHGGGDDGIVERERRMREKHCRFGGKKTIEEGERGGFKKGK